MMFLQCSDVANFAARTAQKPEGTPLAAMTGPT
jgi:hypothetical protein